jgi:hypothetical protein
LWIVSSGFKGLPYSKEPTTLWSDTPRPNPQSLIDLALYAMLGNRDAWRSEVERLILIEYRRNERECLPWWKRLAGWAPSNRDEQGPIA